MTERLVRRWEPILILAATAIAVVGVVPYAGGWNDGSRLAAVESLAECGTLCIDDSVFVKVPADLPVYTTHFPSLYWLGTQDKLLIDGHYYSDKSPVPTVLLAGVYRIWLAGGGSRIAEQPAMPIILLTLVSATVPFVVTASCVVWFGRRYQLPPGLRLLYLVSFLVATIALPYTRQINNGIQLLGIAAVLCALLADLTASSLSTWERWGRPALVGLLAGLGYTIDLGIGPPLLVAVAGYAAYQMRSLTRMLALLLAIVPFFALHHVLNYAVGGTIQPANAVLAYLQFPGSPFNAETATGGLKHGPLGFVLYGSDLLFGKKGFLTHNWPLFLAFTGAIRVAIFYPVHRPALGFCLGWSGLAWLAYAATSTNLSGTCCSIRWFVPLIAPGYWALAIVLKEYPRVKPDLLWLTAIGAGMTALMWYYGPWMAHMVPGLWGFVAIAGIGWGVIRYQDERHAWVKRFRQRLVRMVCRLPVGVDAEQCCRR